MFAETIRARGRAVFRSLGIEISRSANPLMTMLDAAKVDVVFDVGANSGQFACWLRRRGYTRRIVSFEPLAGTYAELVRRARHDPNWETHNFALGNFNGDAVINRSVMTQFSSLVAQTELTRRTFNAAEVTARETVTVRTLDAIFADICDRTQIAFLKIDTQGFEKQVLDGAQNSLPSIVGVRLELSYEPLYEGELPIGAMRAHIESLGYTLVMLEPLGFDPSPRVLQADGTFLRFAASTLEAGSRAAHTGRSETRELTTEATP